MIFKSALLFLFCVACVASAKHEKILLTDVQSMTLHKNQFTTGRRSAPIPQLKCLGGKASSTQYHPDVVQCYNRGTNGEDVQWECKADLDNAVRFGKLNVYCEGYDYPDDPYVLKGSCGLEYHLEYNDANEQKYHKKYSNPENKENESHGFLIFIVGCAIVFLLYLKCRPSDHGHGEQPRTGQSRFFGGGPPPPPPYGGPPPPYGGGPSAPPGDAPPPYGFRADNFSKQGASASGYGQEQTYGQQRHTPMGAGAAGAGAGAGAGTGPGGAGFWTGLGTGGFLGYMLGGRNTGRRNMPGGSSWFQSNYATPGTHDYGFFGSDTTRSQASTSSSSGTGTRSTSGFGETRRR